MVPLIGAALLAGAAQRTTRDGVFTAAQADRGKVVYERFCSSCHLEDLSGGVEFEMNIASALKGARFLEGR